MEQSEAFSLDSGTSTILLGLIQILGTYSATLTVDRFGRKIVLIISASCSAIGLLSSGVFDYLSYEFEVLKDYSWILILSLASVIYFANMGVCTVCYVVLVEILPFKVRIGSIIIYSNKLLINFILRLELWEHPFVYYFQAHSLSQR